jgi:hypothetical protein
MAQGLSDKERLAVVETQQAEINRKIDKIMDNHLPHIQAELSNTRKELNQKIDDNHKEVKKGFEAINNKLTSLTENNQPKPLTRKEKLLILTTIITSTGLVLAAILPPIIQRLLGL